MGPSGITVYGIAMIDTSEGWACGNNGKIFHYQNSSWDSIPSFDNRVYFSDIKFTDPNHGWMIGGYYRGLGYDTTYMAVIYFYDGISWSLQDSIPVTNGTYSQYKMQFIDSLHGFFSIGTVNIYYEYNWGNWYMRTTNLGDIAIKSVYFTDTLNGWIGGSGGKILRTRNGGFVTDVENLSIDFVKNSIIAYPNPSRHQLRFDFSINKPQRIKLKLYNVSGYLVDKILDEYQSEGEYTAVYNCNELSPGVYFYQLESAEGFNNGKIIIQ
jgi:hypothetical protein